MWFLLRSSSEEQQSRGTIGIDTKSCDQIRQHTHTHITITHTHLPTSCGFWRGSSRVHVWKRLLSLWEKGLKEKPGKQRSSPSLACFPIYYHKALPPLPSAGPSSPPRHLLTWSHFVTFSSWLLTPFPRTLLPFVLALPPSAPTSAVLRLSPTKGKGRAMIKCCRVSCKDFCVSHALRCWVGLPPPFLQFLKEI